MIPLAGFCHLDPKTEKSAVPDRDYLTVLDLLIGLSSLKMVSEGSDYGSHRRLSREDR